MIRHDRFTVTSLLPKGQSLKDQVQYTHSQYRRPDIQRFYLPLDLQVLQLVYRILDKEQ